MKRELTEHEKFMRDTAKNKKRDNKCITTFIDGPKNPKENKNGKH